MTEKRKLRRWLMRQYEFMNCANLLEFKQRLQWLSEGMLRNHIATKGCEINHWEINLYNAYANKLKEIQK